MSSQTTPGEDVAMEHDVGTTVIALVVAATSAVDSPTGAEET